MKKNALFLSQEQNYCWKIDIFLSYDEWEIETLERKVTYVPLSNHVSANLSFKEDRQFSCLY